MSNDCGCAKSIANKIYVENNCCNKKEKTTNNCNTSCCSSCGKQIDLIDSDLYSENIYNYTENTNFNTNQIILLESEMSASQTDMVKRDEIYTILQETDNKTKVLIQLKTSLTGHYGLKCVATIRQDDGKYTIVYSRQYRDELLTDEDPKRIKTIVYVYTNNLETATFKSYDITTYSCDEIINLLSQYITETQVQNLINNIYSYLNENYYNKEYIDYKFENEINLGEDCLFQVGEGELSTVRKETDINKESIASGVRSFAMQNGRATNENSIAFQGSLSEGKNSVAFQGGIVDSESMNSTSLSGGKVYNSNNSVAISNGIIQNSQSSIAIMGGSVSGSPGSVSIGSDSKSSGTLTGELYIPRLDEGQGPTPQNNISIFGGVSSGKNSIAIGAPEGEGSYCTASNRGSVSIGSKIFNSGFFSSSLGYGVEIGRYRETKNSQTSYVYCNDASTKGKHSIAFGQNISVAGPYNLVAGESHFIKGNHAGVFGNGNLISGDVSSHNLLFGNRCRIENGISNIIGGTYNSIISTGQSVSQGSVSLGDTLIIDNLYLIKQGVSSSNNKLFYYICYKEGNEYRNLTTNTKLGFDISTSIMEGLRNGGKKYLGSFNFYNKKQNAVSVYPGVDVLNIEGSGNISVALTGITPDHPLSEYYDYQEGTNSYFRFSARFSSYSNILSGSGSVALGSGNRVLSDRGIAIGTGNEISNKYGVTIGKFNNTKSYSNNGSENIIFSVGDGYYDSNQQKIFKKNVFEVVRSADNGVEDINFVIGNKWYSMKEILNTLNQHNISIQGNSIDLNNNESTTNLTDIMSISSPANQNGYVRLTDTIVYDPNNVIPQSEGETDD